MLENAGEDLINSLLILLNKIKKEQKIPEFMRMPDITTIYTKKGSKFALENFRGIFQLSCIRTIMDKFIYFDWWRLH